MINLCRHYSIRRIKNLFFLTIANLPMPGHGIRPKVASFGGVDFVDPGSCFVGKNVLFDTVAPERIHIGKRCVVTTGTIILTHYQNSKTGQWYDDHVYIGDSVFIGANTIIAKNVTIGHNVMIGAGSVVTKNIPDNEVWAGNPAKFIRKRDLK